MSFYTLTAFHIEWLVKVWNPADDNMLNLSPQIHLRFSAWKKKLQDDIGSAGIRCSRVSWCFTIYGIDGDLANNYGDI